MFIQFLSTQLKTTTIFSMIEYYKYPFSILFYRLHGLVTARQNDRSTISSLERRLQEERRIRTNAENQVAQLERRQKKVEEQAQARAHALANAK